MAKETTVVYKSYLEMMDLLLTDDSAWREAMTGLLRYGFDGIAPESTNPLIQAVYVASMPTMKTAKERYEKAVEDGKKGGRKQTVDREKVYALKEKGYTHQQIADELGCTKDAIKKIFQREGTKGTNLNVYVYENENENAYSYSSVNTDDKHPNKELANAQTDAATQQSERELENLSRRELESLLKDFRNKVRYLELYSKYGLKKNCLDKDSADYIEQLIYDKKQIEKDNKKKKFMKAFVGETKLTLMNLMHGNGDDNKIIDCLLKADITPANAVNFLQNHEAFTWTEWNKRFQKNDISCGYAEWFCDGIKANQ